LFTAVYREFVEVVLLSLSLVSKLSSFL